MSTHPNIGSAEALTEAKIPSLTACEIKVAYQYPQVIGVIRNHQYMWVENAVNVSIAYDSICI